MDEFKVKMPAAEYKEKPRSPKVQAAMGFLNRQKYLLLSILVFFCEITSEIWQMTINPEVTLKEITLRVLVFGTLNYLIFFFMSDCGRDKGIASDGYLNAKNDYDTIHKKFRDEFLYPLLQNFCAWKRKSVTEEYRRDCLMDSTISYDTYVKEYQGRNRRYIKKVIADKNDRKCVLEANAYKSAKLQASMIWERSSFNEQIKFMTKSGKNRLRTKRSIKIGTITLLSILSVAVESSTVAHFDWSILINVLVLSASAFFGFRGGYDAYALTERICYETRTNILNEAYDWAKIEKEKTAD